MATTDARPGFRLPWSSDQPTPNDETTPPAESGGDVAATTDDPSAAADTATSSTAAESVVTEPAPTPSATPPSPAAPAAPKAARKPSKFLADLTRAMQAAAESAREETLSRFQASAKGHVEEIHARSASEAADLRRQADDDVAAVREWSKAEIARIREETETKIADRKSRLEGEIEDHAARIEREIERVQSHVAEFEAEMARFFERLLAEEDPTRFASMAENLPEPPPFDDAVWSQPIATPASATMVEDAVAAEAVNAPTTEAVADDAAATGDPEAAMAAIQAAFEAAAEREAREAEAASAAEASDAPAALEAAQADDPRISALELADGLAAAEAEAFAAADSTDEVEIPTIADEALAARLAGLVPAGEQAAESDAPESTRVVVNGLVSVASIAGFKRSLARVPGVQSVGVSSGPDGEFVFAVTHSADLNLRDVIPTLPSYQARVTGGEDGVVEVTAHDPDSEA